MTRDGAGAGLETFRQGRSQEKVKARRTTAHDCDGKYHAEDQLCGAQQVMLMSYMGCVGWF